MPGNKRWTPASYFTARELLPAARSYHSMLARSFPPGIGGAERSSGAASCFPRAGYHSSVRFRRPVAFSRKAISLRSPAFSSAYLSISWNEAGGRYWPTFDQFSVSMKVNKINVSGPVAWVHGIEKTRRRKKTGEVSSSRNFGTNIFVNRNGHWLMVFHQAAEIPGKS